MLSRTLDNAKQEIQWTLLGVWGAMTEGARSIPVGGRLSPVRVLASESSRTSEKNSKSYPRKKRKRQTGEPNIALISDELQALANKRLA